MSTTNPSPPAAQTSSGPSFSVWDIPKGLMMWISVIVTAFLVSMTVMLLFPFVYFFDKRRHSLHAIANFWGVIVRIANPWWRFHIQGTEYLAPKGQAVVYVANHQSQADIIAMFILGTRFRWLSKRSVFNVPFLGWSMWAVGYVPVDRSSKKSGEQCLLLAAEHLKNKTPMVFFPEGTRSKTGKLGNFKSGAFRLAQQMETPIVPITFQGFSNLLPKGSWLPKSAKAFITIHPPIDVKNKTVNQLVKEARECIQSALPPELQ